MQSPLPTVIPAALPAGEEPTWTAQVMHGKYYPHLDGLRCLAILPVVLYHLSAGLCPAGFMGVDVFFVISGYLICGGIVRELEQGTFSLRAFYFRRIRRIMPAYFALVFGVLATGVALYYWSRIVPLAQTVLFSSLFSTNLYFWLEQGYFQPNAHGNPLLNLWSLGVEEQFYLVIPVLLLGLWKLWPRSLLPVLGLGLLVSLALCAGLGRSGNSTTAFYLLPSRAWELLAGALLALAPRAGPSRRGAALALAGLALVLGSFWSFSTAIPPSTAARRSSGCCRGRGASDSPLFPGWCSFLWSRVRCCSSVTAAGLARPDACSGPARAPRWGRSPIPSTSGTGRCWFLRGMPPTTSSRRRSLRGCWLLPGSSPGSPGAG